MKRYTKNTSKGIKDFMTQRIASPQNVATVAMPRDTSGKIALPVMRNVGSAIKKDTKKGHKRTHKKCRSAMIVHDISKGHTRSEDEEFAFFLGEVCSGEEEEWLGVL